MASQIESFVVKALVNYYDGNYEMFFEYLDDNVIWYGPKEGQHLVGKKNLLKANRWNTSQVKFYVENIMTQLISYSQNLYSLLVTYRLYSRYPDGTVREHKQHIILNGQKCHDQNGEIFWRCPFIHVSDVLPDAKSTDRSPPIDSLSRIVSDSGKEAKRLVFPGDNYTSVYIKENTVRYVMGGKGILSFVHTDSEMYTVHQLLKKVGEQLPSYFYRCHSSYIVNLRHVRSLSSHKILMDDGTEIPVPIKRFSEIRDYINNWMSAPE